MRIGVISKDDERGGGASVVASQLAEIYKDFGHDVEHLNIRNSGQLHPYGDAKLPINALKRLEGIFGYQDHTPWELATPLFRSIPKRFDALHLHDMSTTLSHSGVGWLAKRVRTIWTIHDCSPFTAGCLYPAKCSNFEETCHSCPQLGNWPLSTRFDRTPTLHARRKRVLDSPIHFTAPSTWMVEQFRRAGWPSNRISKVSNATRLDVFSPKERHVLRQKHGISKHKGVVLLYSAGWLHDSRKGPHEAARLAKRLAHLNPLIVLVGRLSDEAVRLFRPLNFAHFGFVRSEAEKAELFAMCDAALTFSAEENAPLIAIECLSSGVPLFGYAAGGLSEMVETERTGYLAPVGMLDTVIDSFDRLHLKLPELGRRARDYAEANFDYQRVAMQYLSLLTSSAGVEGSATISDEPITSELIGTLK